MGDIDVPDEILEGTSKIASGECYFYDSNCEMFDKRDTQNKAALLVQSTHQWLLLKSSRRSALQPLPMLGSSSTFLAGKCLGRCL